MQGSLVHRIVSVVTFYVTFMETYSTVDFNADIKFHGVPAGMFTVGLVQLLQ
jgi:hypothetical protein